VTRWLTDRTVAHLQSLPADVPAPADRYELREAIGRGGMGVVFRAFDRELEREVAVKVLQAHAPGAAARLLQEARILGQLEHPGILPVHDIATLPDGRVFYVMKLVRGERLDQLAGERALPDLLGIFDRLCDAVAFAHAHGVIHRDLKPENIMIGAFGEVLVLDWGVAKVRGILMPEHGAVVGTPGYMAPEQAAGRGDVDERADVYALGGLLAFLLCGKSSVEGRAEVPRALSAIVRRARAEAPEERYPSAAALAADVKRYIGGFAVEAHRESIVERARRIIRWYRTPILLVLAYLLMRVVLLLLG
jgi:eukaryotic-like serine/threonine-protein kinase